MWPLIAGALGLGQALIGNDQANKAKDLEATTQKYSPWTHMQAQHAQNANPLGTILGGITAGMGMQQQQQMATAFNQWLKKQSGGGGMASAASTDAGTTAETGGLFS